MITHFISRHLDKTLIQDMVIKQFGICKMCGTSLTKGILAKNAIKHTFTDHEYLKYDSDILCIPCVLSISSVIKTEKGYNGLRNYSYIVTKKELKLLQRQDILQYIIDPPEPPFVFVITYLHKKHTTFKAIINYSKKEFVVTTDTGNVSVDQARAGRILKLIQPWYTIVPGKEKAKQPATWFTKENILRGCTNYGRIQKYGNEKYIKENMQIDTFRGSLLLKLITHTLNKGGLK